MSSYCLATYRSFDEKADFHKKATSIAVGLTVGSWTELPEAQKASMEKHLGKVVSVEVHEPAPGEPASNRYADITIAYPDVNYQSGYSRAVSDGIRQAVYGWQNQADRPRLLFRFPRRVPRPEIWHARCS